MSAYACVYEAEIGRNREKERDNETVLSIEQIFESLDTETAQRNSFKATEPAIEMVEIEREREKFVCIERKIQEKRNRMHTHTRRNTHTCEIRIEAL